MIKRSDRRTAVPLLLPTLLVALAGAACTEITSGKPVADDAGWRTPLELNGVGGPLGIPATDGKRLFAEVGRSITAFDVETGRILWSTPRPADAPSNVVTRGGRVFSAGSAVIALDAESGKEMWRFTPDATAGLGRIAADQDAVYVGTASHKVQALRASDGRALWTSDIGPQWQHGGIVKGVSVAGDTVYAAAEQAHAANGHLASGWIVALDRLTGAVLWKYQNGTGDDLRNFGSSPAVAGRLVVASDFKGNRVVAVDRFTGREVWRIQGEAGFIGPIGAPEARGDTVYFASGDTYVYAVDLHVGRLHWKSRTPAANTALALCGESLVVNYQGVAVIDPRNGQLRRRMHDSDNEFTTSGFAVAGKRAFVLGNKAAYALSCQ
ncbi:MAG TPA: PQQ-binding-like beta-propeller repeat protein [Longimicrobiaceae bacterium]